MTKEPFLRRLSYIYRELYRNKSKWLQTIFPGRESQTEAATDLRRGMQGGHTKPCHHMLGFAVYTVWDNVPVAILYIVPVFTFKHMLSSHEGICACAKSTKLTSSHHFITSHLTAEERACEFHSSDADDSRLRSHPSPWMRVQKAVSRLVSLGAICWACFRPAGASLQ